ncbi:MAG: VWA domain-containing protein [Lachnospiraceae bacterium]|nr:VWA domain-containing protein [Lachnospiraceae bacterium]
MELKERMLRWRLILGQESEQTFSRMGVGPSAGEDGGPDGLPGLSEEQWLMDQALEAIYNPGSSGSLQAGGRGAGSGPSSPRISRWLGDVRTLFDKELVKVIQTDAMERCGLKQLIFEPELLENMEPDMNLAASILLLKEQIPKRSKDSVREFMKRIVEELNKLLEQDIRRAVTAAVNRRQHSPIPSASALDVSLTIRRGMKNYNPQLKTIVPEKYYFFDRTSSTASGRYTVILDVDQSGSMGESVIYASVISCILASMAAVKTRIVAFDTQVVDLTEKCEDPVDLLFGFQLGGGTDINQSVAYCGQFVENPPKTLFFLVSDLMENGNRAALLHRLRDMKESGVTVVCLLAIADGGKPYYDAQMAERVAAMGIPCFACSPQKLPELFECALKGRELTDFQKKNLV